MNLTFNAKVSFELDNSEATFVYRDRAWKSGEGTTHEQELNLLEW